MDPETTLPPHRNLPLEMRSQREIQIAFAAQLGDGSQLAAAFELLPNAYFFVKDRLGHFIHANRALIEALGLSYEDQLIGKTDFDVFETALAEEYIAEDQRVMKSRKPLLEQVWLVPSQSGELNWYVSSKAPLMDSRDEVIGIVGVMRGVDQAGSALADYQGMNEVITHVKGNFAEKIEVGQLAKLAGLSLSQFERRFKALFQCTPHQYLHRIRIHAATKMLIQTSAAVGHIALDCGFYDQSHFTRLFKRQKGLTPLQYRKQHFERTRGRGIE
ncbi:MAG: AraC family transcriptional regulator [Verrucomicrobiota bacterium]